MKQGPFREKRSMGRIPVNEEVVICHRNMFYSGTALNLSEKGMFIGTKKRFNLDNVYLIIMRLKNRLLRLPAKIKRSRSTTGYYDGIGIELVNPPHDYLKILDKWKG